MKTDLKRVLIVGSAPDALDKHKLRAIDDLRLAALTSDAMALT